jgi:hypothetical protein
MDSQICFQIIGLDSFFWVDYDVKEMLIMLLFFNLFFSLFNYWFLMLQN